MKPKFSPIVLLFIGIAGVLGGAYCKLNDLNGSTLLLISSVIIVYTSIILMFIRIRETK